MSSIEFDQFLIKNTDYLKPFAFTLTHDHESAKDLMQETMYRALANKEKYSFGTNIKAWLYTIMRNIFINEYRRKSRQHVITVHDKNEYILDHSQYSISGYAENDLSVKEILATVHTLPDIFKTPFQLYFEGYKYNEIAESLNEPLGTIKSRIHFARKLLKKQLSRR